MVTEILGTALTALPSIVNAVEGAKQYKLGTNALKNAHTRAINWYERDLSTPYSNMPSIQGVLSGQRDLMNSAYKTARANAVTMGASDSSVALQKMGANRTIADTSSNLGIQSQSRADAIRDKIVAENSAYANTLFNNANNLGANIAQGANDATQVGANMLAQYNDKAKASAQKPLIQRAQFNPSLALDSFLNIG